MAAVLVGDGTTTVVLLAGELLKEAKPFIEDGVHSQNLIQSYRPAAHLAIEKIKEVAISIEGKSLEEKKSLLAKCAATTLSSMLIGGEKEFFASMVVDAVLAIELELKSEKENAEIRLSAPLQYQSIVDAEWNIIYDKLDKRVKSGAKIVLSRLAIGDLRTQYFADRDIFCAGHVAEEDLQRVVAATGGTVQTTVNNVIDELESAQGDAATSAMGGRGQGAAAFQGRGRGMRRR
ncbi:T-complex protein 1 subunit eta [Dorcoceras hygrometricum]|uniref:CCT-eta n=1 Tax=Dorcoceras hygrometricum TaxID=472368 RepID=A0A2Z7ALM6_9LAMI|nr:T-complex protein 1 subunit eta [Dorcoceras hygrometricum]